MTNEEIIARTAIEIGLYSVEEIEEMIMNLEDIPLHTFAFWKAHGFSVKAGQKHIAEAYLWRFKKGKKKDDVEIVDPEDYPDRYYRTRAYLFHRSQVDYVGV